MDIWTTNRREELTIPQRIARLKQLQHDAKRAQAILQTMQLISKVRIAPITLIEAYEQPCESVS